MMETVLVTGDRGFVGGYIVRELLSELYSVVGIDNESKYGFTRRPHDGSNKYLSLRQDVKETSYLKRQLINFRPRYLIANAAMVGGVKYFHDYAYDLISENEKIIASTFDAALSVFDLGFLEKIVVVSSSMVFESHDSPYDDVVGPKLVPKSSYGFQKLSSEVFAKAACDQYGLPYTIVRPYNCVGTGEYDAFVGKEQANEAVSHVIPDFVRKVLLFCDPIRIYGDGNQVRCFTHGRDIGRGIRLCMEKPEANGGAFNISSSESVTMIELLSNILECCGRQLSETRIEFEEGFEHDVQVRIPKVGKAKEILGFEAQVSLEETICEVVDWMKRRYKHLGYD